ncbi:hypothetical protein EV560_112236 [Bosea sp. BK604]|nr:hypothetical protein EV560_112236 [Bosea sp. BK604]
MIHQFAVGDQVSLAFGFYDQAAVGLYAVTRLLPSRNDGEPQYRVKGSDDRERVIGEAQIERAGGNRTSTGPVRQRSPHNPITEIFNRLRLEEKR